MKTNWRTAPLTERQRAICEYAAKLTHTPAKMTQGDIDALRRIGLGDEEVLSVVHVTSYFAYMNRLADALHVDPEDTMPPRSP